MSLAALVCKIAIGAGAITALPGMVESPRYEGAEIRLQFDGEQLADIVVSGPYDRSASYAARGVQLSTKRLGTSWLIEARQDGAEPIRETLLVTAEGTLLWMQFAYSELFHAAGVSAYSGSCE